MLDKNEKVVIALGYFDSVHLGHKKVIENLKRQADLLDAKTVVFTFKGNLRAILLNENEKQVYNERERESLIFDLGVDEIYFAPANDAFLSMSKLAFLNFINRKYNVVGYVCGEDYRFGKFGKGDVEYLKKYASEHSQTLTVVETENYNKIKISTTNIKKKLSVGDIKGANAFLGRAYSITGKVFKDRMVGRKIGFPTVNIKIEKEKQPLKNGVYAGHLFLDGKFYKVVINYGARPTYSLEEKLIETHIIGFTGELYEKEITVFFDEFLREIKKFNSEDELINQLNIDVELAKGKIYD